MNKALRVCIMTIIVAFALAIMPLPEWAKEFRPDWVTLVLIYWAMAMPMTVGVIVAWCAGLLLDVAYGSLMGQNAAGMAFIIWFVHIQHQRLRVASLLQQAMIIFVLLFIKQTGTLWVDGMLGRAPNSWFYYMPTLISALLWPWVYLILRDLRRKFSLAKHSTF
jgi:rod shape-determining protein MreD